ncbi:MAG: hypothetical protein JW920_03365 [Deltaproteobacteria bacterium]|nr:hypothetical protein [Deltaproteobacteria bacterium]
MDITDYLHKRSIIVGDVKSGKTVFCQELLKEFLLQGYTNIAVFDLAPENRDGIGGKMQQIHEAGVLYFTTTIYPPRLLGKNEEQILKYARRNVLNIERLFEEYRQYPREIVFVNDVSLYLHAGDLDPLLEILSLSETQVLNAYYGATFDGLPLSKHERGMVEKLMKTCDTVIELD